MLKNRIARLGAELIKEVAEKTNNTAGDGTTTGVVLAQAIVRGGMEEMKRAIIVKAGKDFSDIKVFRGIQ